MYIGNTVITQGFTPQVDFFSGNASTTAFTLSRPVASVYQMIVNVANVDQNPGSAYTVSGNTITFASAPPSGTNNIWVEYTSLITQVIQPSAGTVGTLQLQSNLTLSGTTTTNTITSAASTNLLLQTNNGTTAVTIDTNQNVGVGVTPSSWASPFSNVLQLSKGTLAGQSNSIMLFNNAYFNGTNYKYINTAGASVYEQSSGSHDWQIAPSGTAGANISFTTAMTLDNSGNLLIGSTSTNPINDRVNGYALKNNNTFVLRQPSYSCSFGLSSTSGTNIAFYTDNGSVVSAGAITSNGSSTAYNTSVSDYRLKENVVNLTGGLAKINLLRPVSFTWINSKENDYGFIAHELQTVIPQAINGAKDAVNANGNPEYQTIFPAPAQMIASLVSAIQELSAKVTALEAKVA